MSSRIARIATIAGLSLGLVGAGTGVALASTPTPSPTHTANFVPLPNPLRPEHFQVLVTSIGGVNTNDVEATGPVALHLGTDTTVSNTRDTFARLGNSVNVRHTGIPVPVVNRSLCTVSLSQTGLWRFQGGTGLYAHARGFGSFQLSGLLHFPQNRLGRCSIPRVSPFVIQRDLIRNIGLPAPDLAIVGVVGSGLASR